MVATCWFLKVHHSFYMIREHSIVRKLFPFFLIHSLIHSFIYISMEWINGSWMYYVSQCIRIWYCYYHNDQIVPVLASENPLKLTPMSFAHIKVFFEHFLIFWYNRMFQTHLCPSSGISYFSEEPWFLLFIFYYFKMNFCWECSWFTMLVYAVKWIILYIYISTLS